MWSTLRVRGVVYSEGEGVWSTQRVRGVVYSEGEACGLLRG